MEKKEKSSIDNFLDTIGEILAFLTAILFAVLIINANFNFLPENILYYCNICRNYLPIALIIVVGLEFTSKRSLFIRILFYLVIAVIVIFQFFPDTWSNFIGIVA